MLVAVRAVLLGGGIKGRRSTSDDNDDDEIAEVESLDRIGCMNDCEESIEDWLSEGNGTELPDASKLLYMGGM